MVMVVVFDDDQVFFRNHEVFAVHFAENLRLEHVGRRTCGVEPRLEQDQAIYAGAEHVDVVGHQQYGQS